MTVIRTIEEARHWIAVACQEYEADSGSPATWQHEMCYAEAMLDVDEVAPKVAALLRREYGLS